MHHELQELEEAKRQFDSLIHKLEETVTSLESKPDPTRYKSQITLAKRRIAAMKLANELIENEGKMYEH
ncbi:MAG: hypothetical protein HUJ58_07200 [Erysipelotrichaceae bacterium]|nr:hypothetical protein [Erysipelotrichaceae bacterium]